MKNKLISLFVTLIVGFIFFYLFLPSINILSFGFWLYLIILLFVFGFLLFILDNINITNPKNMKINILSTISFVLLTLIFLTIIIVDFICSPIFNSRNYYTRISVNQDAVFEDDIKEVDFTKLPLLDKDSSSKLGDRKIGSQTDWVSQFYVSDLYTQINYNNEIIRVTPLEYNGLFKYISNHKDGIKGYIKVNSVNGESDLVTLDKGMKYMPSAILGEDLYRKLRFSYPTLIFDTESFEIDNDGNPYWIIPYVTYHGVSIRKEVMGVVILDPITGDSKKYNVSDIPSWVDHVYHSDLIIEELNDWGTYGNGFLNSIFGQRNVVNTTEGYNYLILNDDVYLYTGVTSVSTDESNIGFVLTNLRTHETNFYSVSGAEEFSAASSAEGLVQEKGYKSTFPLLINLNNRPTYLLSLKDNAGLVKMYAFVDVCDYQKVVTADSSLGIEYAYNKYIKEVNFDNNTSNYIEKNIVIKKINTAIIDGNTYYYLNDNEDNKYSVNINVNKELLPFISINDKYNIKYIENNNINSIIEINKN